MTSRHASPSPRLSPGGRPPRPSVGRILQADLASVLCLIGPLVAWGLWLVFDYFGVSMSRRGRELGPDDSHFFLYLASGATVVLVPLLVVRVRSFFATFESGVEVVGRVLSIAFFKDRGTVEYEFEHEGETHRVSRGIHKTARTRALRDGQEVVIVFDPQEPKRALLRDLFV